MTDADRERRRQFVQNLRLVAVVVLLARAVMIVVEMIWGLP